MPSFRDRLATSGPLLIALMAVGLTVGGLVVGYEPVGGDPDRLYRPLKAELARAFSEGRLPLWSDRFGVGVPLMAESHVAALYPPNWVLYRLLDVATAYRWAMWLHYLALAAATYAYARCLRIEPWGAALAAVAFTLCGFQAIHSSHEPLYHILPFLPLALLATERFLATGRVVWVAVLALLLGAQLTLGHFQIQMWTAALVLLTGLWRLLFDRQLWRRWFGLGLAVVWAGAIAALQLALTWDLARDVGFTRRDIADLAFFSYPPAHWNEPALPRLFAHFQDGPEDPYWFLQATTRYEAAFYVGTVPLILAFVGLVRRGGDRMLTFWTLMVPLTWTLACLPRLWPEAYAALLHLPGLGYFRCPARYTLLTSLALALLAGHGFDRAVSRRRFCMGLGAAIGFGTAAAAWAVVWSQQSVVRLRLDDLALTWALGTAAVAWGVGLMAVLAWRRDRLGGGGPVLVAALELGLLYHHGTTQWGWPVTLPDDSPMFTRLAQEPDVGRVIGFLDDLPVMAGWTTASPYLGMGMPPPYETLRALRYRMRNNANTTDAVTALWLKRLGVTHGIWSGPVPAGEGVEVLATGDDPALERVVYKPVGTPQRQYWSVVRYPDPWPDAWAAPHAFVAQDENQLAQRLSLTDARGEAWFLPQDAPAPRSGPRARAARVLDWNGQEAVVEHDGTCDLVITRTFDPGWKARVNDGPERPVARVNGGLQAVRLNGPGPSRVRLRYAPTGLVPAALLSLLATLGAVIVIPAARQRPD